MAQIRIAKAAAVPADRWQEISGDFGTMINGTDPGGPGFVLFNNVVPYAAGWPISYGINADICGTVDYKGEGRFGPFDNMNVWGGPKNNPGNDASKLWLSLGALSMRVTDCRRSASRNERRSTSAVNPLPAIT